MAAKLGQLLLSNNIIDEAQLNQAMDLQKQEGGRVGSNLIKLGFLTEDQLVEFLSKQYSVPAYTLSDEEIDASIIKFIPYDVAYKYQIFPVSKNGASLTLAMTDPSNVFAIDDVKFMTGYDVKPVVASESAVKDAIARHYEQSDALQ
ncbi:type II secretion system protein GspE, partial [bacterium]|nr:type II secretion system protein GspE [bacterium]